jgi:hypothetical protein
MSASAKTRVLTNGFNSARRRNLIDGAGWSGLKADYAPLFETDAGFPPVLPNTDNSRIIS